MHLTNLTLKGFKSFAEASSIRLEPGVTAVVGPNGSGKSNVVDAVAWVLGAQAPSSVRCGKMEDVIFSGTDGKPALGRAEVSLTVDNSDGVLPVDLSEVKITRTLFRGGESTYSLNGRSCRLIDVLELMAGSGVGRQQHTIVSQSQIDAVLNARPEQRREVIEEAAGTLKYRKRRERAERRLLSVDADLVRIGDLLREVRRQLRPLQKQAEAARRHADLVAELKTLRVHLALQEVNSLRQRLREHKEHAQSLGETQTALRNELQNLNDTAASCEQRLTRHGFEDHSERLARLEGLHARATGLEVVVGERLRSIKRERAVLVGNDLVASVEAEVEACRQDIAAVVGAQSETAPRWHQLTEQQAALETDRAAALSRWGEWEDASLLLSAEAAEAAEMRGELAGLSTSVNSYQGERLRLQERKDAMSASLEHLDRDADHHRHELSRLHAQAKPLRTELAASEAALAQLLDRHERAAARLSEAEAELRHWTARREALAMTDEPTQMPLHDAAAMAAVLGAVQDLVEVERGCEAAFMAAVGDAVHAVVVRDSSAARHLLQGLEAHDTGNAVISLEGLESEGEVEPQGRGGLGSGLDVPGTTRELTIADGRTGSGGLGGGVGVPGATRDMTIADGRSGSGGLGVPGVTREMAIADGRSGSGGVGGVVVPGATGEMAIADGRSGSGGVGGVVVPGATGEMAIADGRSGSGGLGSGLVVPGATLLREQVRSSHRGVDRLLDVLLADVVLVDSDWRHAATVAASNPGLVIVTPAGDRFSRRGWRLGVHAEAGVRAALTEATEQTDAATALREQAATELDQATQAQSQHQAQLESLRKRSADLDRSTDAAAKALDRADTKRRDHAVAAQSLSEQLEAIDQRLARAGARQAEIQARLPELEAAETREREHSRQAARARAELDRRAAELDARAYELRVHDAELAQRRELLETRLVDLTDRLARYEAAQAETEERIESLVRQRAVLEALGEVVKARSEVLDASLARIHEQRRQHSEQARLLVLELDDLRRRSNDVKSRLDELRDRAGAADVEQAELRTLLQGVVERLRDEFGVSPAEAQLQPEPQLPEGLDAAERVSQLSEELELIGPVNPLALAEFEQLQERHDLLSSQLEDIKAAKRDLRRVISSINAEIKSGFMDAFVDVTANFELLFDALFPGGEGRLTLTDPDDLLQTGIEISAKPPGKNIRRLSLLSGGERTLASLAFLFAVFRSRPSPFYLLDEVEAALDDVNLHRFLKLLDEFRADAQLLIVTHQKRTMEAADCLHGVSMKPGGTSVVVSERVTKAA